jgi:hypothetical protein
VASIQLSNLFITHGDITDSIKVPEIHALGISGICNTASLWGAAPTPKIVSPVSPLGKREIKNKIILLDTNRSVVKRKGI